MLELMVVLVLMALVYAMAVPMISAALPGTELKSAARELAAGLRQARSQAVTRKNQDKHSYLLPPKLKISLYTAQSELVEDKVGAIRFYADGSSTGGRIAVSLGERKYLVDVDWLTGQVRVLD
jgi:general secretion pathway protein H